MNKLFLIFFFSVILSSIILGQETNPADTNAKDLSWLTSKIDEAKKALAPLKLARSSNIRGNDWAWKEVGLAAFNPENGDISFIRVRKNLQTLYVVDPEWEVRFEYKPSGLTWNGKNTAFRVIDPQNKKRIVIALKWVSAPNSYYIKVKKGKKLISIRKFSKDAQEDISVPYSHGLHLQELILVGQSHFQTEIKESFSRLNKLGIKSLVEPAKLVTERFDKIIFERLGLIEQSDPNEFREFRKCNCPSKLQMPKQQDITLEIQENLIKKTAFSPFERMLVRLGVNGEDEFKTRNYAGAVGLMQFTNNSKRRQLGTWDVVRAKFPQAQLPRFNEGSTNHTYSIMAAVLLHDINTYELVQKFGSSILQDSRLEYYLAAGYNGGIGRVVTGINKYGSKWTKSLLSETVTYVEELEYLQQYPINPV